ncbi:MAG: menaquinone biosynthesis protein [Deltaproteobacteria bacterium]|nr:menaquinone biosynthesis protein [Candidatus Anaeroferrophillacea bacterium]
MNHRLTVGEIAYLNCFPLFHYLKYRRPDPEIRYLPGHPADLNRLLAAGGIDLSPSSSLAYALDEENCFILPDLAIASRERVDSVLLAGRIPIEELAGRKLALTSHSLTSVNLLKIILFTWYGYTRQDIDFATTTTPLATGGDGALLIGDEALAFRCRPEAGYPHVYDLGTLWRRHTGLPFVYALWIGRRDLDAGRIELVRRLHRRLGEARSYLQANPDELISAAAARYPQFPPALIRSYWQHSISWDLDDDARRGLERFYRLAHRYGLLERIPALHFLAAS